MSEVKNLDQVNSQAPEKMVNFASKNVFLDSLREAIPDRDWLQESGARRTLFTWTRTQATE